MKSSFLKELNTKGIRVKPVSSLLFQTKKLLDKAKQENNEARIKKIQKLFNGYKAVYSKIGRIYPQYKQISTKRFVSSNPCIQSLPKYSSPISPRSFIIPEKDSYLASFDVSQGDIRVMAELAGNEHLIANLNKGKDIHQEIAQKLLISRDKAKSIIFGICYNMSNFTLAQMLQITEHEAQIIKKSIIDIFGEKLSNLIKKVDKMEKVKTTFGTLELFGKNKFPILIQTCLALFMEYTIKKMYYHIQAYTDPLKIYIINYDEIIFNISNEIPKTIVSDFKRYMENHRKLKNGTKFLFNGEYSITNYDKAEFKKIQT